MKKMLITLVAICALFAAGALYAASIENTAIANVVAADMIGLPSTVLDQVSTTAIAFCIRPDIQCLDVYDPVTCSNGVTYSNGCYAYLACATGCTGSTGSES